MFGIPAVRLAEAATRHADVWMHLLLADSRPR